jgi:hypothetical protein
MDPAKPPVTIGFCRFSVLSHRRELLAEERPVALGARAFDMLLVAGFRLCRSGENVNDKLRTLSRLVEVMTP